MTKGGGQNLRRPRALAGRVRSAQGGATAVEMALVAPVLIIILLGIVQFGTAFFLQNNMVNAAREAARRMAVGEATVSATTACPNEAGSAQRVACDYLSGWGGMTFTVTACDPDNPNATLCPGARDVSVVISVPRSQVALGDILGLFETGELEPFATLRQE